MSIKRPWETANEDTTPGWASASHPYASAYAGLNAPVNPSPLHYSYDSTGSGQGMGGARGRGNSKDDGTQADSDEEDEDDDEDDDGKPSDPKKIKLGKDGKPKTKLTRGSRCRKIKMRCIPDESSGPTGPCKRCKAGGHECVFEESNRGKRSTRKNEALSARLAKLENALRGVGGALSNIDQPSLNSFSTALHANVSDPDMINLITSFTTPSTVPTLAVAQNRTFLHSDTYVGGYGTDGAPHPLAHLAQPPLSPRLHSLPDNVLSPLGLLAEASLQGGAKGKGKTTGAGPGGMHGHGLPNDGRASPLNLGDPRFPRAGSMSRVTTSDVRGQDAGQEGEGGRGAHGSGGGQGQENAQRQGQGTGQGGNQDMIGRGVASQNYFRPGVGIHVGPPDNRLPELLTITTREEIAELFSIFYDHMVGHVPLIYREFHTPDLVLQRSQFLCTVICAIAARYYDKKPALHGALSAYAKRLAFEVPSRGYKSVEVVQAYLLLSLWTLGPEKTFEQDRTWMMLGMAIRMATDLNLHRKSMASGLDTEEGRARDLEIINRERCWLHCFILDRSISAQMGKPYTIKEDYIIRKAAESSWHQQKFSLPSDHAMAAYSVLQQIMSRAIDSIYSSTGTVSGLRQDADYMLIVRSAHEELRRWLVEWNAPDHSPTLTMHFEYLPRVQFYYAYHSLVLYSFGLENAIERCRMDIPFFLSHVYESATRVCVVMKEHFLPKGFLPYLPDTNFVMCSYALLSLLKLLKPELRVYHDSEEAIFKLVGDMADILENCATDPSHQPAIYAAFIREIIRKTQEARVRSTYPSRAGSPAPGGSASGLGGISHAGAGAAGTPLTTGLTPSNPAGVDFMTAQGLLPITNGTIDPNLTGADASAAMLSNGSNGSHGHGDDERGSSGMVQGQRGVSFDPMLSHSAWSAGAQHFQFIPQGGDMMILPSAAGPSSSLANSPSAQFASRFPGDTSDRERERASIDGIKRSHSADGSGSGGKTAQEGADIREGAAGAAGEGDDEKKTSSIGLNGNEHDQNGVNMAAHGLETAGWAEYLPTFMNSDGFDGWDGSMLLPGFGRGQITLGGGLLHSQYGSGIITPAQHTPIQSRAGSKANSRAQSPVPQ